MSISLELPAWAKPLKDVKLGTLLRHCGGSWEACYPMEEGEVKIRVNFTCNRKNAERIAREMELL